MSESQFELEEFKESYTHYRHLELERSRHLTLFFTIVAGLLGFLGFLLKDGKPLPGAELFLFLVGLLLVFLQVLALFTFVAVRRVGDARAQHSATIRYLRNKLTEDKYVVNLWTHFDGRPHVGVHDAAEWTLNSFAGVFGLVNAALALHALAISTISCWQGVVVLTLTSLVAALHIAAYIRFRPPKQHVVGAS